MKKLLPWLAILGLMALLALYGVTAYPHSPFLPTGDSLEPPSAAHWLGTDNLGIDIYAQVSRGFFHSLAIGLAAAVLAFAAGGGLGLLAGYRGGRADHAVSFMMNLFLSVPQLPIMIVIGAFWGQSTWNVIAIIAAFSWAGIAKVVRAKTMALVGRPYVRLARSYGGGALYLFRAHLRRELLPLMTVNALAVVGRAIVQESSLAFLGLSDPLAKSWGLMISRAAAFRGIYFTPYWLWWLLPPVCALIATILCLRLLERRLEILWLEER